MENHIKLQKMVKRNSNYVLLVFRAFDLPGCSTSNSIDKDLNSALLVAQHFNQKALEPEAFVGKYSEARVLRARTYTAKVN